MDTRPEILLIEDDFDDRALFAAALHMSGLQARLTFAGDAAEAVTCLNHRGMGASMALPALVVLDLGLPGLQGPALLQVIRNAYRPRTIPVVVLTGSYRTSDRSTCESWGISDYLVKPRTYLEQVRVVASLQRWLVPLECDPPADPPGGDHPLARPASSWHGDMRSR